MILEYVFFIMKGHSNAFYIYIYIYLFCKVCIILCFAARVPIENILYLGGPNIASEIYNKEYANARICGAEKWRLARFLRHPHFIVWQNGDLVTHEVRGGLKNVYAIGAGKLPFQLSMKLVRDRFIEQLI